MNHGFSSAEIILIIGSVFTGIVSVIGAIKGSSSNKKLDDAKDRLERQDTKLEDIHTAANGNLKKALARIEQLVAENKQLREDIIKFNRRRNVP